MDIIGLEAPIVSIMVWKIPNLSEVESRSRAFLRHHLTPTRAFTRVIFALFVKYMTLPFVNVHKL